ncbi:hypothetical protein [Pseudomonas sp. WS 5079]|uniref:hypothetical protein n=1 Tax=Pseudomonas sp. WS 5079 TaxID=2717492 RepID=UPI001552D6A6|nr:hypothetical protein [Pseudomonas sp. WS 5079]NMX61913.1 hypothetical protein [Pseudomonas sp. WS 5079]
MGSVAVLHIYLGVGRYSLLDTYNKANNNLKSLGIIGKIDKVFRDAEGAVFSSMVKEVQTGKFGGGGKYEVINRDGEIVNWEVFKSNDSNNTLQYISGLIGSKVGVWIGGEVLMLNESGIVLLMSCPDNINSGAYFVDGTFYANHGDFVKWRDSFVGVT